MNITKKQYKALHREYRIAFRDNTYVSFFNVGDYELKCKIQKIVHSKVDSFSNCVMFFNLWGIK